MTRNFYPYKFMNFNYKLTFYIINKPVIYELIYKLIKSNFNST